MKRYGSFLVRCWLIEETLQDIRSVIDVEHIQSGERMRVASIGEAEQWMFAACRSGKFDSVDLTVGQDSTDRERQES
jgi:hypothetical protein